MRNKSLNLLYYPFKQKVLVALFEAQRAGIPLDIFETFRSRDRQAWLYSKGRTSPGNKITWAKPGQSYHNYGVAVDLVLSIDGRWSWKEEDLYREAGPYFEAQGLTWLGRTSGDLVHFQLKTPYKVSDLKGFYDVGGLEKVWMELDKVI